MVEQPNQIVSDRGNGGWRNQRFYEVSILQPRHQAVVGQCRTKQQNGHNTRTKAIAEPTSGSKHLGFAGGDTRTSSIANTSTRSIHLLQPLPSFCAAHDVARSTADWSDQDTKPVTDRQQHCGECRIAAKCLAGTACSAWWNSV
jgi:hypothetical protein